MLQRFEFLLALKRNGFALKFSELFLYFVNKIYTYPHQLRCILCCLQASQADLRRLRRAVLSLHR